MAQDPDVLDQFIGQVVNQLWEEQMRLADKGPTIRKVALKRGLRDALEKSGLSPGGKMSPPPQVEEKQTVSPVATIPGSSQPEPIKNAYRELESRLGDLERKLALCHDLGQDVFSQLLSSFFEDKDRAFREAVEEGWNRRAGTLARALETLIDLFDCLMETQAQILQALDIKSEARSFAEILKSDGSSEEELESCVRNLKALVPSILEAHQYAADRGIDCLLDSLHPDRSKKEIPWLPKTAKLGYKDIYRAIKALSGIERYRKIVEPFFVEAIKQGGKAV